MRVPVPSVSNFRKSSRPAHTEVARLIYPLALLCAASFAQSGAARKVHPVTKRPIAQTMSVAGADWLDRPEREREEQPQKAVDALHLAPGMNVGEVGAGTGYYALRIAKNIQPGGVYYANDLAPAMLARLQSKADAQGVSNIQTIVGSQTDPRLPRGRLDYVIMVDVYHELAEPQQMLAKIADSLKPEGKLVLLEFRKEDPDVPIRPDHEMTVKDVKAELSASGYALADLVETLPWQHMFFFRHK